MRVALVHTNDPGYLATGYAEAWSRALADEGAEVELVSDLGEDWGAEGPPVDRWDLAITHVLVEEAVAFAPTLRLVALLEACGVPLLNSTAAVVASSDKLVTHAIWPARRSTASARRRELRHRRDPRPAPLRSLPGGARGDGTRGAGRRAGRAAARRRGPPRRPGPARRSRPARPRARRVDRVGGRARAARPGARGVGGRRARPAPGGGRGRRHRRADRHEPLPRARPRRAPAGRAAHRRLRAGRRPRRGRGARGARGQRAHADAHGLRHPHPRGDPRGARRRRAGYVPFAEPFHAALREVLDAAAPWTDSPHTVLLADGPADPVAWEASVAARDPGIAHVALADLAHRGGLLVERTSGRAVDVVYRRTAEERLRDDAGALNALGEALLGPLRAGRLAVVNAFGGTHPTVVGAVLAPRHVDLRPFVVGGRAVPGGLSRVALGEGELVVNLSQGGGGKDVWVLPG